LTEVSNPACSHAYFRVCAPVGYDAAVTMWGWIGIGLFLLMFLMIGSGSRKLMTGVFAGASDWITKYAPLSYAILAVIVVVPIVATIVVMKWPPPPEPEDPLARYKHEDVMED
jgi:hypothetical protein